MRQKRSLKNGEGGQKVAHGCKDGKRLMFPSTAVTPYTHAE